MINLLDPENKECKEWLDELFEEWSSIWTDRPEKFYLSENICILEEDNKLYYLNEETGEKILVLENEDQGNDGDEEIDVARVYFLKKIDEHKFIYQKNRGQWDDGCGIFDISNFSDHPVHSADEWGWCSGLFGEYIYSASPPDYLKTNVNTYKTVILLPGVEKEYYHFHTAAFSPDGTLFTVRETVSAYYKNAGNTYTIELYDVESSKLLASYNIYAKLKNDVDFYGTLFKDNKTIYIMERDLYDNDKPIEYLVEIDISGVHTSDVNSEQPWQ